MSDQMIQVPRMPYLTLEDMVTAQESRLAVLGSQVDALTVSVGNLVAQVQALATTVSDLTGKVKVK